MTLTMIKFEPDMGRLVRWAERRKLLQPRGDDDLGYALHALLCATFGQDDAPKPFALLREPKRPAALLGYSPRPGQQLRELAAAVAEPDAAEAVNLDSLAVKAMPERWSAGQRFGFAVRVRPMRRTDRGGDRARVKEVDAAALAKEKSRGEVYKEWLEEQLGGAKVEMATLEAFRRSRVRRRDAARHLASQEGPDASFVGTLSVAEPVAFAATLARGVGRHRAFGFGMLLLRPAG